jgi:hypothetical protein
MTSQVLGPTSDGAEVKLSEKVLGSVITAWKIGREALTLLVIGTVTILLAFWLAMVEKQGMAIAFLLAGCAIIGVVAYKFYTDAVIPVVKASKDIKQNAQLMDAVQDAALELTSIIQQLNDYALVNADQIVSAVDQARVVLNLLPGGAKILELEYFKKGERFARGIRSVAAGAVKVTADIQASVTKADAGKIAKHVRELNRVKVLIENELMK